MFFGVGLGHTDLSILGFSDLARAGFGVSYGLIRIGTDFLVGEHADSRDLRDLIEGLIRMDRDFSDLSGDGFGFHTDLYGFVRIIWVGEHTDSMSAIKKCQYWQIINVELIIYGKKQEIQNWDAQIMGIYVLNTYYIGNVAAHIYAKCIRVILGMVLWILEYRIENEETIP